MIASVHDYAAPETPGTYYRISDGGSWTVPVADTVTHWWPTDFEDSPGVRYARLLMQRAISRKGLNLNPAMAPKQLTCSPRRGWNLAVPVLPRARARSCC